MSHEPFLVVGLGNPGPKYAQTRHNVGFEVIDRLQVRWNGPSFSQKFHSEFAQVTWEEGKVFLMKPQTYMNRSGISVSEATAFYKIPPERVLVISDDLDLPPATLRLRTSGGAGGHNGLKSIIEMLGTQNFPRLRIGIGRSIQIPSDVYVLSRIPTAERPVYDEALENAVLATESVVKEGMAKAMNTFNQKRNE